MAEGFEAPAGLAPAELPSGQSQAALLLRPMREAGAAPTAVVILLEMEARGTT
jgi:hypothetical protein